MDTKVKNEGTPLSRTYLYPSGKQKSGKPDGNGVCLDSFTSSLPLSYGYLSIMCALNTFSKCSLLYCHRSLNRDCCFCYVQSTHTLIWCPPQVALNHLGSIQFLYPLPAAATQLVLAQQLQNTQQNSLLVSCCWPRRLLAHYRFEVERTETFTTPTNTGLGCQRKVFNKCGRGRVCQYIPFSISARQQMGGDSGLDLLGGNSYITFDCTFTAFSLFETECKRTIIYISRL